MVVMTPQAGEAEIAAVVKRLEAVGGHAKGVPGARAHAAGEAEVAAVVKRLEAVVVHAKVMPGEPTAAIGAIGDPEGVRALALEGMPGVDQVIPISRPYKLASSELSDHAPTSFALDGRVVGGGQTFCLIAGPCTVETHEQTLGIARAVADGGASMLRGG